VERLKKGVCLQTRGKKGEVQKETRSIALGSWSCKSSSLGGSTALQKAQAGKLFELELRKKGPGRGLDKWKGNATLSTFVGRKGKNNRQMRGFSLESGGYNGAIEAISEGARLRVDSRQVKNLRVERLDAISICGRRCDSSLENSRKKLKKTPGNHGKKRNN